jgi:hypothetical protein
MKVCGYVAPLDNAMLMHKFEKQLVFLVDKKSSSIFKLRFDARSV